MPVQPGPASDTGPAVHVVPPPPPPPPSLKPRSRPKLVWPCLEELVEKPGVVGVAEEYVGRGGEGGRPAGQGGRRGGGPGGRQGGRGHGGVELEWDIVHLVVLCLRGRQ